MKIGEDYCPNCKKEVSLKVLDGTTVLKPFPHMALICRYCYAILGLDENLNIIEISLEDVEKLSEKEKLLTLLAIAKIQNGLI